MNLEDAINAYLRYAKVERGLTAKTMEPYQSWLRHYLHWLQEKNILTPTIQDFNKDNLQQFLYYCREERKHRPRTVRGAFAPIRSFGDYLVLQKAIGHNYAKDITLPKKDAAERIVTTDAQVLALWAACDRIPNPKNGTLYRGVLACFAYGGLRVFETLALHITDCETINLSHDGKTERGMKLTVQHGKGEKARSVILPQTGADAVRAWIDTRGETNQEWLWVTGEDRHLGERALGNMMAKLRAAAGLRDQTYITPHSIRHTFATRMLRGGANIKDVQTALGHAQLTTTAIYLHADEERLRSIAHLTEIQTSPASEVPTVLPSQSTTLTTQAQVPALPPRQRRYTVERRKER